MAFNVSEFRSGISGLNGLLKPNLVLITITPPTTLSGNPVGDTEQISLLANAITIPGISFETADVMRQGFGPVERRAMKPTFPQSTVTFYLDNDNKVLEFFTRWAQSVSQFDGSSGETSVTPGGAFFGEMGYYDDYTTRVQAEMFTPNGDGVVKYTMEGAFPQLISDISAGWAQNDEVATLSVQFTYRYWVNELTEATTSGGSGDRISLLQFLAKAKGAVRLAKSLKKPRNVQDAIQTLNNAKTLLNFFGD